MTDFEKIFSVQTLLRQYAPCEQNSIDEVWFSGEGLIKTVQRTQVNNQYFITLIFYETELK